LAKTQLEVASDRVNGARSCLVPFLSATARSIEVVVCWRERKRLFLFSVSYLSPLAQTTIYGLSKEFSSYFSDHRVSND